MKLKRFLTEDYKQEVLDNDKLLSDMAKKIKPQARAWLTAIKSCKQKGIWRGVHSTDDWVYKKVRKNRNPMDTSSSTHNEMDEFFQEKFGWKPRSQGLFVNPDLSATLGYGNAEYAIFPIRYKGFVYSPKVTDMYAKVGKIDQFKNTYTDKGLCKALSNEKEMMINADLYYGISSDVFLNSSLMKDMSGKSFADILNKWIEEELM